MNLIQYLNSKEYAAEAKRRPGAALTPEAKQTIINIQKGAPLDEQDLDTLFRPVVTWLGQVREEHSDIDDPDAKNPDAEPSDYDEQWVKEAGTLFRRIRRYMNTYMKSHRDSHTL